jgi:hypothetical protein
LAILLEGCKNQANLWCSSMSFFLNLKGIGVWTNDTELLAYENMGVPVYVRV